MNKKTASITLKEIEHIPTYLRANESKVFKTIEELDGYLSGFSIWKKRVKKKSIYIITTVELGELICMVKSFLLKLFLITLNI